METDVPVWPPPGPPKKKKGKAQTHWYYIRYQGLWDTDELYDLRADPRETRNLIRDPRHQDVATRMNAALFETLAATDGLYIPLAADRGQQQALRRRSGSRAADFPDAVFAPEK